MATGEFNGTNYALRAAQLIGTMPSIPCNDRVYCMSDECYADAVGDAGSYMNVGGLPAGAVVLCSVIWPIDSDEIADGGAAMAAAVTGQLGLAATTGMNARAADPDLFGDITTLGSATPQVIEPGPDGTTYSNTLDFGLKEESSPTILTAAQALADTEGVAIKMLYVMGGRTQ